MGINNIQGYEDIIDAPHHVSSVRPQMSRRDRAAQFSPFAALAGYGDAIQETGRVTDRRIELTEDSREVLDLKQRFLMEESEGHPEVCVTYFVPDARKAGGAYVTVKGRVKGIDEVHRDLLLLDGRRISLEDVLEMDSPVFCKFL